MNCIAYQDGLVELARGGRMESWWLDELRAHTRQCPQCQIDFDAQVRLTGLVASLSADAAMVFPPAELEATLLAEFDRVNGRHRPRRYWYAGAAIAAALVLGWAIWQNGPPLAHVPRNAPHAAKIPSPAPPVIAQFAPPPPRQPPVVRHHWKTQPAAPEEGEQPFVAIPYTTPLGPNERADIVRMDLPVSALIAAGFPIQVSDLGARAKADLVVSEDGRARAVRLISISNSDLNRSF